MIGIAILLASVAFPVLGVSKLLSMVNYINQTRLTDGKIVGYTSRYGKHSSIIDFKDTLGRFDEEVEALKKNPSKQLTVAHIKVVEQRLSPFNAKRHKIITEEFKKGNDEKAAAEER